MTDQRVSPDLIGSQPNAELAAYSPRQWLRRVAAYRSIQQLGWVTGSYIGCQVLRLASNVMLARLLAPQLFGVMLIVNTLRTGVELLSDIGVGQSIISHPDGARPAFFNTAWTLQIIRGVILFCASLALAGPVAGLYDEAELAVVLPAISVIFLLTGLEAPARFLLQKRQDLKRYAIFDLCVNIFSLMLHVGLALYTPTVWALVGGLLLSTLVSSMGSFILLRPSMYRLQLDRSSAGQILSFGKWVFASSLIYFLSMSFDRLYFAEAIPFALLGVYGVARTFADMGALFMQRIGNILIFPRIAASARTGTALRAAIAPTRGRALAAVVLALSGAIAFSDQVILLLYDDRYQAAAFMLPILMVGVWFSILASMGEAIMMGVALPGHAARANLVKLVWTCAGLPLALTYAGMTGALLVIASSDMVRYASLTLSQRSQGVSFGRHDLALTTCLLFMVIAWRTLFTGVGLTPHLADWWNLGADLHA